MGSPSRSMAGSLHRARLRRRSAPGSTTTVPLAALRAMATPGGGDPLMTSTPPTTVDPPDDPGAARGAATEYRCRPSPGRAARGMYPTAGHASHRHHHRPRRGGACGLRVHPRRQVPPLRGQSPPTADGPMPPGLAPRRRTRHRPGHTQRGTSRVDGRPGRPSATTANT